MNQHLLSFAFFLVVLPAFPQTAGNVDPGQVRRNNIPHYGTIGNHPVSGEADSSTMRRTGQPAIDSASATGRRGSLPRSKRTSYEVVKGKDTNPSRDKSALWEQARFRVPWESGGSCVFLRGSSAQWGVSSSANSNIAKGGN